MSATLLITSMGYSYHLWKNIRSPRDGAIRTQRIQMLTWLFIVPFAIMQLATGFTMMSIEHVNLSEMWIGGSIIGFIIVMGTWFSFIYFLLISQQIETNNTLKSPFDKWNQRGLSYRRVQSMLLSLCAFSILVMIFFMANKVA